METHQVRRIVIDRHRECGIGLAGSCEAIARWLFREHNIVTSASWIDDVVTAARQQERK